MFSVWKHFAHIIGPTAFPKFGSVLIKLIPILYVSKGWSNESVACDEVCGKVLTDSGPSWNNIHILHTLTAYE